MPNASRRRSPATVAGPYVNSSTGPFVCLPSPTAKGSTFNAGDIDPDVFVDGNGPPYLLWKANPGGMVASATIWSQPLSPDGRSFAPGSSATELIDQDQSWELTVENPDLVLENGTYDLFYSGGTYESSSYGVGYAVCAGPSGPCGKPDDQPILQSRTSVVGPGGEWAFQDGTGQWWMAYAAWTAGAVGYPGGARSLRMDPLCFVDGDPVVLGPTTTPQPLAQSCPTVDPDTGYRLVASDGGLFAYGSATFDGSAVAGAGGQTVPAPIVGTATDPATGGYWEVGSDGTVYAFGAPFDGDLAGRSLNHPIVGLAASPDGGGYWLVASDGGVFAFGDAAFYGSTGSLVLDSPVVGMAASPDGQGYWLVASDGGIFAFGDAAFYGSMGGQPLNRPVVGMTAMPDGQRLLARGVRRRPLRLRVRPVLGLDRLDDAQPADRRHGGRRRRWLLARRVRRRPLRLRRGPVLGVDRLDDAQPADRRDGAVVRNSRSMNRVGVPSSGPVTARRRDLPSRLSSRPGEPPGSGSGLERFRGRRAVRRGQGGRWK